MTDEPEKTPEPIPAVTPAAPPPSPASSQAAPSPAAPSSGTPPKSSPSAATPGQGPGVSSPARSSSPPENTRLLPLLNLAGFVILAGGIAYLWTRPMPQPVMPAIPADQSGVIAAMRGQVANLQSALEALDAREKQDISDLHQQIASLPQPAGSVSGSANASASSSQIASLQDRLGKLEAAQQAAAQQVQAAPSAGSVEALSGRLDSLSQREAGDAQSIRQTLSAVQQQLADLSDKAKSLAQDTRNLPRLTAQSARIGQVLQAEDALAAGKPLGTMPDAPPALAQFATAAPPTEAALRLAYPAAARAAEKAGGPQDASGGFWHRVWLRVQNLVTLRQGDRVIVGDQTGGTLAHAQRLLDAGDLSGAVTVLGTLQGPAAGAMEDWVGRAKALIAARQALAEMAAQ